MTWAERDMGNPLEEFNAEVAVIGREEDLNAGMA